MNYRIIVRWIFSLLLLSLPGVLSAHHSVGVFETTTPIHVKGIVKKFNWANPHSSIIVEQETEDGRIVNWALESSAPINSLLDRGFTKESFKPGDVIEACGYAPKKSRTPRLPIAESDSTGPPWLAGADKVITGRFLMIDNSPVTHWSHYGPLEDCISEEELKALSG